MRLKRYLTALSRYHRSKGHGIHSPFAFSFVLNVLRCRLPYYAYEEIETLRTLAYSKTKTFWRRPELISVKNAKLLFRIVNHFNPSTILQIGTNYGVSSASMLVVSSKTELFLCQAGVYEYPVTQEILSHFNNKVHCFLTIDEALEAYSWTESEDNSPFILINTIKENDYSHVLAYLHKVRQAKGVIIIRNLNKEKTLTALWDACRDTAPTGMTFCNGKMGIIVATPKLPHQNFSLWF